MKRVITKLLYKLYSIKKKRVRQFVLYLLPKLENGELLSGTLRAIFRDYHKVKIGKYSYGWFRPERISPNTVIGSYCSIGPGVCFLPQNHPLTFKSTHPYFYNPIYGKVGKKFAPEKRLVVGNDVWIGQNALILPQVRRIGDGVVIGAGAVVTKDVPDYAVVAGNPARIIKYRFSRSGIEKLKKERWWEKDFEELEMEDFTGPFEKVPAWNHLETVSKRV